MVWGTLAADLGSARTGIFGKENLFPSLSWKFTICPIVRSPDMTVTIARAQGQPFIPSITQLRVITGNRGSWSCHVLSKWDQAVYVFLCICFISFPFFFLTYFTVTDNHGLVKTGGK